MQSTIIALHSIARCVRNLAITDGICDDRPYKDHQSNGGCNDKCHGESFIIGLPQLIRASERARERRFSCTDHAGDTEKHFDGAAQEVKTETGSGRDAGREYCRFLFSEATSNSFFWAPASFLSDGQLVGLRVIRRRQLPQRQCRRAVDHTSIIAEA